MFIQDAKTRRLLNQFCTKGISPSGYSELEKALDASSLAPLLQHLKSEMNTLLPTVVCPCEWSKFIRALASSSPVCALVHPNERVFDLLKKLITEDITSDPTSMLLLQQEVPVLFDLLSNCSHLPKKTMTPLIHAIVDRASAPFVSESSDSNAIPDQKSILEELAFFPNLPKVRARGIFKVDSHTCHEIKCTKQSSGHPSLLPGIFTLFCPHGEFNQQLHYFAAYNLTFQRDMLWLSSNASP